MKKSIFLLLLVMSVCASAQIKTINYFNVSSSIAQPVKLETSIGTFSFNNTFIIEEHLIWIRAYDAHGNRIIDTVPARKSLSKNLNEYWWEFDMIYESNTNTNSYSTISNNTSSLSTETVYSLGSALGGLAGTAMYIPMKGYPNVQIQTGYSKVYGTYAALGAHLGGKGGLYLQGSLYKDFSAKEGSKGIDAWSCHMGFYFGDTDNTGYLNLCLIGCDNFANKYNAKDKLQVKLELAYSRYFTNRLGVMFGVGGVFYDVDGYESKTKGKFEASISLTYKIFTK